MPIVMISGREVAFDEGDQEIIERYSWHTFEATRGGLYVKVRNGSRNIYLHRLLMADSLKPGMEVDHVDRNGLNNRRSNLRVVTHGRNMVNTLPANALGVKNVSLARGRYQARVRRDGVMHYLGSFGTLDEAVAARDEFTTRYGW